ncbi:MAG TPA: hypothetical protein VMH83_14510, partial [Candidatus Acidoferrum sp.]|nr:hypothetical protein [Candidatus Acidoferrum sp.]
MKTNQTRLSLLCAALIAGAAHGAGAPLTEVTIPGGQILMPESLTSAADGTVIIGSIAGQKIFKANPGSAIAELWISPGASIFGVFADDKSGTLWACSGSMGGPRPAD